VRCRPFVIYDNVREYNDECKFCFDGVVLRLHYNLPSGAMVKTLNKYVTLHSLTSIDNQFNKRQRNTLTPRYMIVTLLEVTCSPLEINPLVCCFITKPLLFSRKRDGLMTIIHDGVTCSLIFFPPAIFSGFRVRLCNWCASFSNFYNCHCINGTVAWLSNSAIITMCVGPDE